MISAAEIPQDIKDAALAAAPGLIIQEAEIEDDGTVYSVVGTVNGIPTEVEVTTSGQVLEVESGDDSDDDTDSEDDDEEEDD